METTGVGWPSLLTSTCQPSDSKACSFQRADLHCTALHCPAVAQEPSRKPSNSPAAGSTYAQFHLSPGRGKLLPTGSEQAISFVFHPASVSSTFSGNRKLGYQNIASMPSPCRGITRCLHITTLDTADRSLNMVDTVEMHHVSSATKYKSATITQCHLSIKTTMPTTPMDSRLDVSFPKMPMRLQFPGICFTNRCAVLSDDPSR